MEAYLKSGRKNREKLDRFEKYVQIELTELGDIYRWIDRQIDRGEKENEILKITEDCSWVSDFYN